MQSVAHAVMPKREGWATWPPSVRVHPGGHKPSVSPSYRPPAWTPCLDLVLPFSFFLLWHQEYLSQLWK